MSLDPTRVLSPNHGDQFAWNDFVVLNNQWGREFADDRSYQRVVREDDGSVSFEFCWRGMPKKIKGFPVVMAGWHFGNPGGWMTPRGHKGFPSSVEECRSFNANCSLTYTDRAPTETGIMNVAWDMWFARGMDPTVPCGEIMVWPWHIGQVPIGNRVDTLEVWGATWDLFSGQVTASGAAWRVFSFVRQQNTLCIGGDLRDFITNIRGRGWLEAADQIVGLEFGTELLHGCGAFRIESYTQD